MHRGFISLALAAGLFIGAMADAARAQSSAPASSSPSIPGAATPAAPPIVFYLAKGGPGACGPGCQEWIAAEGEFDSDAEPRLWELLRKLGTRKLPVFFHSPGGLLVAAFEVGRLMRARGLTAGVGWTIPAGCDKQNPRDRACDTGKRSGEELSAELDSGHAVCASACVYAFLGGTTHEVAAGARLGIHDMSMSPTIMSADEDGHVRPMPRHLSAEDERRAFQAHYAAIAAYLQQMGVSADLLAAARAVPHDQIHILTRDEIVALGIDRREAADSAWALLDTPSGASAVKLIEARDPEAHAFHRELLSVSCRDKTAARLQYVRETGSAAAPGSLRLVAGGRSLALTRLADMAQAGNRPPMERLYADLPLSALDDAAFVIEPDATSGQSTDGAARPSTRLTVQAAAPALVALARRCGSGAH